MPLSILCCDCRIEYRIVFQKKKELSRNNGQLGNSLVVEAFESETEQLPQAEIRKLKVFADTKTNMTI